MSMTIRSKHFVVMGLVALAVGSLGFTGCDAAEDAAGGNCEASISSKAEAFGDAVAALEDLSVKMKGSVAVACAKIATDLGATDAPDVGDGSEVADEDVTAACDSASAALKAEFSASASLSVSIQAAAPKCTVAAEAQLDCEGSCQVDASCDGGSVETRCDPGELSVTCEGTCAAGATCEGSATVAANCEGSCDGTCEGTCEGSAGTAQDSTGKCEGKCKGTCKGNCTLAADAKIECGASATCKGTCEGTATAPKCEAELTAPECDMDADCKASCNGQASVKAECSSPSVEVVITGSADTTLKDTLTANLPAIMNVAAQGELAVDAITGIVEAGASVTTAVTGSAGCLASLGGDIAAQVKAAASAQMSVNVSVSASASASGSASGG